MASEGLQLEGIKYPGQHDFLLGRGGETNNHSGNILFRQVIKEYKPSYQNAPKTQKPLISQQLVTKWRNLNPPGRFLERVDDEEKTWKDVGDTVACRKTSKALGERGKRKSGSGGSDDEEDETPPQAFAASLSRQHPDPSPQLLQRLGSAVAATKQAPAMSASNDATAVAAMGGGSSAMTAGIKRKAESRDDAERDPSATSRARMAPGLSSLFGNSAAASAAGVSTATNGTANGIPNNSTMESLLQSLTGGASGFPAGASGEAAGSDILSLLQAANARSNGHAAADDAAANLNPAAAALFMANSNAIEERRWSLLSALAGQAQVPSAVAGAGLNPSIASMLLSAQQSAGARAASAPASFNSTESATPISDAVAQILQRRNGATPTSSHLADILLAQRLLEARSAEITAALGSNSNATQQGQQSTLASLLLGHGAGGSAAGNASGSLASTLAALASNAAAPSLLGGGIGTLLSETIRQHQHQPPQQHQQQQQQQQQQQSDTSSTMGLLQLLASRHAAGSAAAPAASGGPADAAALAAILGRLEAAAGGSSGTSALNN